jgi:membrane protease YdiL (CAAX protease family)
MHGSLGAANVVYAALGGIVLGMIYLWADRNLWVVIILHSLFDVIRVVQFFLTGNDLPL